MACLRLTVACLCFGWSLANMAQAEETPFSSPDAAANRSEPVSPWLLKVYRLHHADAVALDKTFSGILDPSKIRMVADERSNVLIVRAASETHQIIDGLISKLDVPQMHGDVRPSDQPTAAEDTTRTVPGVAEESQLDTVPAQDNIEEAAVAVVRRARPQTLRAMATLLSDSGGVQSTGNPQDMVESHRIDGTGFDSRAQPPDPALPAEGAARKVTVIRIPGGDVASVTAALAQALYPEGSGTTAVVVPASPKTARAVEDLASPEASKIR